MNTITTERFLYVAVEPFWDPFQHEKAVVSIIYIRLIMYIFLTKKIFIYGIKKSFQYGG